VIHGLWTHADVVNDSFTFLDLLEAHEILAIKSENAARAREAIKA
jgi:hypothetical protein